MVNVPTPTSSDILIFLAGFLLGVPAPYWYAQERVRGFVRVILGGLPYEPPPGEKREEAMLEAVNTEANIESEEKQGSKDDE